MTHKINILTKHQLGDFEPGDSLIDIMRILQNEFGITFELYNEDNLEDGIFTTAYQHKTCSFGMIDEVDLEVKYFSIETEDKQLKQRAAELVKQEVLHYSIEELQQDTLDTYQAMPQNLVRLMIGCIDDDYVYNKTEEILHLALLSDNEEVRTWALLAGMRNPVYWDEFSKKLEVMMAQDSSETVRQTAKEYYDHIILKQA